MSIVDAIQSSPPSAVTHQWVRRLTRSSATATAAAAAALNRFDVAIIQHEYGIFGGTDGADVLDVVRALQVPAIVVLHTVLTTPTAHQRAILEELARSCVAIVTMTQTAKQRLTENYPVAPYKVHVIPHGAVDNRCTRSTPGPFIGTNPIILTWGLLGEGKGIEWAIDAMAALRDIEPAPHYWVVGQTHPRVLEQFGEGYRNKLVARANELGLNDVIRFDARYLETEALHRVVQQADIVLLPYDSRDQVTSGVLVEAIAAGKPVVSTGFPHARELLSSGAGLLVNRQDPQGMATALRRVLTEPGLATSMAAEANRLAPELLWSAVADKYRHVAAGALSSGLTLASA